jgi:hypothetical protein
VWQDGGTATAMDKTSMESAGGTEFGFESHGWKVSSRIGKPTASYKIFHSEEFRAIFTDQYKH